MVARRWAGRPPACRRRPGRRCPAAGRPARRPGRPGTRRAGRPRGPPRRWPRRPGAGRSSAISMCWSTGRSSSRLSYCLKFRRRTSAGNGVDRLHRLAEAPAGEGRPAAARVVRDHQRKPLVLGPRPERGLAQPRVAHHGHAAVVDVRVGLEDSPAPGSGPRPRRRWRPTRREPAGSGPRRRRAGGRRSESRRRSRGPGRRSSRRQPIAALQDGLDRPAAGGGAAGALGRAVVDDAILGSSASTGRTG